MLYRILLFILLGASLCADVELTFLPNKTVQHESLLDIDLKQQLPGIQMDATMEQKLVADIKIVDRSDSPVSRPPINMLFTLKDLSVKLRVDDKEAEYQVNKPNTSLFLAEVHDMIDRPIKLRFEEGFRLMPYTQGLVQLSKELPVLSQIHPQSLIEELFQHQFSLAGHSLEVGKEIVIESEESIGVQPQSITYTVEEINDKEVIAKMKGKILPTSINMEVQIPIGDEIHDVVRLAVEGEFSGHVKWSRSNALRYTLEANTTYHGAYQIADWEWYMDLSIKHQVHSK